jgi:hypothetical protein
VKLIILIHVLASTVLLACLQSPTCFHGVACPQQFQDPESLRNLPAVFGRDGEGSAIERNSPTPQHNLTAVLNLQQQRSEPQTSRLPSLEIYPGMAQQVWPACSLIINGL